MSDTNNNLDRLTQLLDELGTAINAPGAVSTAPATGKAETARTLIYARRALEDLKRGIEAQEKERNQLRALQEVGAVINSSLDLTQVLSIVMDAIVSLTKAERALLLLWNEQSGELEVQVARNMDRETIEKSASFEISRSIVRSVWESGTPVVTMNAQEDDRFSAQESIISYNLRSILCVPLELKESSIGVIYADNRVAAGLFSDTDRDLLAAFANQAAVAIENARLFRQIRDHLTEITEMKTLMDNVFESIASGVITIDEADRIALYNRAAETILGVPANSVVHQVYVQALEMLHLPVGNVIQDVKGKGGIYNMEMDVAVQQRPGATTLNMTFSPLLDSSQQSTLGVAMVLDDVSEKKRLESVRRYLPPALVDKVRDIDAAQRPQRRMITVLYADIRGYSTFSERFDPRQLIQVLNGYFTEAVQAITFHQGLTDKFMGDAVMALFNTPLNPQTDHVERAVRTAIMMSENLMAYREQLPESEHLHFGIGIHTGEAVVGNVGSDLRKDYSAIGDAVNLAKRLQEIAQPDQMIVSQDVYLQVVDFAKVRALPRVQVKGRQAVEQTYELLGVK